MTAWKSDEMAQAWQRSAEARNRMMAPATERMFALGGAREGARVLDLGTGTGDTAFMLAARVGASGAVVATDVASSMVEAASKTARTLGLSNIKVRVMDAGAIDLADETFDCVFARHSLMFVADLGAALAGVRRVLRENGRLAAIVWAPLEDNPFNRIAIDAVVAEDRMPSKTPEVVRAFCLSDERALLASLTRAGLRDCVVERVVTERTFASAADAVVHLREMPMYRELMSAMNDVERERALAGIAQRFAAFESGGRCAFPATSLVVAGSR